MAIVQIPLGQVNKSGHHPQPLGDYQGVAVAGLTEPQLEGGPATTREVKLVLAKSSAADGAVAIQVWLHNSSNKDTTVPVATCLGQGGLGSFVSLVSGSIEAAKAPFAWRFTRITGHKKDNAELANGFMVFNKAGTPIQGKPKLTCLHEIEKELGNSLTLYGHAITRGATKVTITPSPSLVAWVPTMPAVGGSGSDNNHAEAFSASALGQYLRSHEDTSGAFPKCAGLVRPIFEVKPVLGQQAGAGGGSSSSSGGGQAYVVQPGAPPGQSALWLFTTKKIEMPAGSFVALG